MRCERCGKKLKERYWVVGPTWLPISQGDTHLYEVMTRKQLEGVPREREVRSPACAGSGKTVDTADMLLQAEPDG